MDICMASEPVVLDIARRNGREGNLNDQGLQGILEEAVDMHVIRASRNKEYLVHLRNRFLDDGANIYPCTMDEDALTKLYL